MGTTRFDLEQSIMEAWQTENDLQTIYDMTDDEDINRLQNALLGLIELHNARCNKLFRIFESCVRSGQI